MNLTFSRLTFQAFCAMARYDLTNTVFGFRRVQQRLKRSAVRRCARRQPAALLCAAVNLAACFYFKPVRCLQRSVVTVRLLRKYGIDGHLAIGYRPSPFLSHAWVEVDGQVVNDSPAYKERLEILWTI